MTILSFLAIALYLGSSVMLGMRLSRGAAGVQLGKLGIVGIGLGAVLLHATILYQDLFTQAGLNLGVSNASSLIAWFVATLLLLAALSRPVENLGIVLLPAAAITIILARLFPTEHVLTTDGTLEIHILVSMLAYSLLTMAAVQAILLSLQDRQLHRRRPGGLIRALPPLQIMESLLFDMIWVGFMMLSVALVTGFIFLNDMFAQHLVHKTVLSIAAWSMFGILLWGRQRYGWRARVASRWTLWGFLALLMAYMGSKFVLEVFIGA